MLKNKEGVSLILWVITLIFIGSMIGVLTQNSVDTWYLTLNRSPWTPPNYVFGIAWTILYAMIGASGWLIWRARAFPNLKSIKISYILQLVLNWSWMPLFFRYHFTGLALVCMVLIILLVTFIIIQTYNNKMKMASVLLMPYLVWLYFAEHLNFYIWYYN